MSAMVLEIPDEAMQALRLPKARAQEELRQEFAVFLVKEGLLPRPQARLIADMERLAFEDLLARRKVPWEGTAEEVLEEVTALRSRREGQGA